MKVTRYSASGSTQRKGTLAMFWVMWLVTASSITEPMADSASQRSWIEVVGLVVGSEWISCREPFPDMNATTAQSTTNPAYRNDQAQPSALRSNAGSNSSGKPISASSEAKLERAKRR